MILVPSATCAAVLREQFSAVSAMMAFVAADPPSSIV
jgi:hypothetical protein